MMKLLKNILMGLGLLFLLLCCLTAAQWNTRPSKTPYGTYSLAGSRFTSSELITVKNDLHYARYQNGLCLSQGTMVPMEEYDEAIYQFVPDNGLPAEYYFYSGGTLYQVRNDTVVSFERIDKRPVYINFHP